MEALPRRKVSPVLPVLQSGGGRVSAREEEPVVFLSIRARAWRNRFRTVFKTVSQFLLVRGRSKCQRQRPDPAKRVGSGLQFRGAISDRWIVGLGSRHDRGSRVAIVIPVPRLTPMQCDKSIGIKAVSVLARVDGVISSNHLVPKEVGVGRCVSLMVAMRMGCEWCNSPRARADSASRIADA